MFDREFNFFLFLIGLICVVSSAEAASLPTAADVPGGIVIVDVGKATAEKPEVFFAGHRGMVIKNGKVWNAVIGVPLSAKPGKETILVQNGRTKSHLPIYIDAKEYPTQYLHFAVSKGKYIQPPPSFFERIKRESEIIKTVYAHFSNNTNINMHFHWPVKGRISSIFGLRRFYNDVEKGPHQGLDIAVPKGTAILAPANAIVINTGRYYFTGNTVFLDHGQGLVTAYCHLSKIMVHVGEKIHTGQIIGKVGSTGRSTGPHLHFGVSLNQVRVDPLLFLEKTEL